VLYRNLWMVEHLVWVEKWYQLPSGLLDNRPQFLAGHPARGLGQKPRELPLVGSQVLQTIEAFVG
jgi:hypothetical protein